MQTRGTFERRKRIMEGFIIKEIIKQIFVNIVAVVLGSLVAYGLYLWLGFEITILIYLVSILYAINSKKD